MAITPLDLWNNLINEVFGDPILFFIGMLILIAYIMALVKATGRVLIMTLVFASVVLSYFISPILPIVLVLVYGGIGAAYAKFVER